MAGFRQSPAMDYDTAWKRLFALPVLVEHLLAAFVAPAAPWLDFGTLRELSASWASDGEQRHGDAAWRADYRDGSGRSLVTLLEFQSRIDPDMAARVLRYAGMARETLRRQAALDADGELRVLPIVIHCGERSWNAPGGAAAVVVGDDGELLLPPPRCYLLLDAHRRARDDLPARNAIAALFRLEAAASPADVQAELHDLSAWLREDVDDAGARAVLAGTLEWLAATTGMVLASGADAMAVELLGELSEREDGMSGLAERARRWEQEWLRQGVEEGVEQGLAHERELLRRQAERKFGAAVAAELARRVVAVTEADFLADVGCWIVDCESGTGLLDRVDRGTKGDAHGG